MGEEGEAEDAGQSTAEKAAPIGMAQMPPTLPLSPPEENPGQELLPARQGPILPGAVSVEQ